jgi:phosphatidate cytidylyltransferase
MLVIPSLNNMYLVYKGIIWFIMIHLMVIFNDTCAYIVGIFFGKTPLIQLSPKKTWEGFMGGIVGTQMLTLVTVKFFVKFNYLICPEYNLRLTPFVYDLECVHDVIYTE